MHYQNLPYDVWEYVTTFLSSEETKKLLCVNRTLFTIAMNERYRTSTIGSLLQADTRRSLARLIDPDVASRVHRLILKPGQICRDVQEKARAKKIETLLSSAITMNKIIKASFSGKRMESPPVVSRQPEVPAEAAAQNLLSIMALLKELRSLVIDIDIFEHRYFHQNDISIFSVGWSTFRTSLRSLVLRVPVEDLVLVLPDLSQGSLPNLDTISFRIIRASNVPQEGVIMVETILPFLQAHSPTLRSLTLDMVERTSLSPLLLGLHLPSLTHFKLVQPFIKQGEADYTGLQHFLRTHRLHLTHFDIAIGLTSDVEAVLQPYPFFSQECFAPPLPRLEHLAIDYSFSDILDGGILRDSMIRYIHRFRSTLVSLKLDYFHSWTLDSVKLLVEGFNVPSARLRRLDILVVFFEPALLTVLAKNLPNLEVLNISMMCITPREGVSDPIVGPEVPLSLAGRQAALDMYALSFPLPQWRLRSLNMQVSGSGLDAITAGYYLERDLCKAALLEALPNVEVGPGVLWAE